jgi:hypothetical protein
MASDNSPLSGEGGQAPEAKRGGKSAAPAARRNSPATAQPAVASGTASGSETADSAPVPEKPPRFHFFIIDAGWNSASAKVLRENFHMIHEFRNSDPLYVLTGEQSIQLLRKYPDLIGKDPILCVHDLHAQGGRGPAGYHGFRLCLGTLHQPAKALNALQEFLRFVTAHRHSPNIEQDIRRRLHRQGMEGAIEVIRESAELLAG